ncbi:MAG: dolichol kinase [Ignavibacteriales bacterium]|nr:dolichol kinase [Ignavibacteriales bacterium]
MEYRHELVRKTIHLTSLSIPTVYYFITKEQALWILGPMLAAFLVTDIARHYIPSVAQWFYRTFGWLLRRHEQDGKRKRLNGATYVLISAVLCVLIFPKVITVTAFAILIISDSTSALIGRKYGKKPFFGKSREGSAAFFVSAILVVLVAPKIEGRIVEYSIGFAGAAVGALVESISVRIDDNLTIPISISLAMWGLYTLLLPSVDVFLLG